MMRIALFAAAFCLALSGPAIGQPKDDKPADSNAGDDAGDKGKKAKKGKQKKAKEKLFDFTALNLDGEVRMPQLLYFLERASAELERASLKRRSFVPEMVRSMDEDAL